MQPVSNWWNPASTIAAIGFLSLLTGQATQIILQWRSSRDRKDEAEAASTRVAEVKADATKTATVQAETLSQIQQTGLQTHTLVNSDHGKALEAVAVLARRVAALTGDATDVKAAEEATSASVSHAAKQALVDAAKSS